MTINRRAVLATALFPAVAAALNACGGGGGGGGASSSSSSAPSSSSSSSSATPAPVYTGGAPFTTKAQSPAWTYRHANPVGLINGNMVLGWTEQTTTTSTEIRAQIYTPAGTKVGSEIIVNTSTYGRQQEPTAAALANGGFVIIWYDEVYMVRGQIFDKDGVKVGADIQVSQSTLYQYSAVVAGLAGGGFVVTWTAPDGDDDGISARIFSDTGIPLGGVFQVNTATTSYQNRASAAGLTGGGFVIVWHDNSRLGGDTNLLSVRQQLFTAAGAKVGAETLVNTRTTGRQWFTVVAALSNGGYVVTWEDESHEGGDPSDTAVKAQIFTAAGAATGSEFLVNTTTQGSQFMPYAAGLKDDAFVITYEDNSKTNDTSQVAIMAQIYQNNGTKIGTEVLVNPASADSKYDPVAAGLSDGRFVIAWKEVNGPLLEATSTETYKARVYTRS
jgi:hypothetical protein